jgi:hypothetical protein
MKIAGLFSGESLMSLALTTTYENGIYRGVVMSLGTPRRMKMTYRYPATKQQYRLLLYRGWSRGRFLLGAARL